MINPTPLLPVLHTGWLPNLSLIKFRFMKTIKLALTGLVMVMSLTYCSRTGEDSTPNGTAATSQQMPDSTQLVQRGEYLVTVGLCDDCHSPKVMTPEGPVVDPARRLSGHWAAEPLPAITDEQMVAPGNWVLFSPGFTASVGPWGTTYAANLTPDDTGTGPWTFDQFKKAIREGKSKGLDGARGLMPPMPWPNFAKMSDGDLEAIFAYLQTLPPVKNAVPVSRSSQLAAK